MTKNFFWGSATASHQVEGGTKNDWSEWEQKNAERLAGEAKKNWAPWQQERFPEMLERENYISGVACDHYHRYEEDFDLAREGGHNAHRFSLEWSRIEPEEGKFDEKELQHYVDVVQALRVRELEPFVTLWHWTLPVWLAEKGGLLAKDFPELFARYAEKVTEALKGQVTFFMTVNEPNTIIANGYLVGVWPPQKKNIFLMLQAYKNLALAHRKAYQSIKKICPSAQVGFTEFLTVFVPNKELFFWDRWLAKIVGRIGNDRFLSRVTGTYDFLGIQNYFYFHIGIFGRKKIPRSIRENISDTGLELSGEGLGILLRQCLRYRVPLYVTEDGLADAEDTKREKYLSERIASLQQMRKQGVDVRGYFHWSLLDNFEWDKGFWPRFGLIEVDRKTLARKPRKSFYAYKEIIKKNT